MPAVPGVEPLKYRECGERNCPCFGKIILKIPFEKKQCSNHHGDSHDKHSLRHEFVDKIFFRPLKVDAQQFFFFWFHGECHIKETIGDKVEPNNLRRQKRERIAQKKRAGDSHGFSPTCRKEIENNFFDCLINTPSFFHGRYDAPKIIIQKHNI